MNDEIKKHLKNICVKLDKMAADSLKTHGYISQTAKIRLLAELVREQADDQEIKIK